MKKITSEELYLKILLGEKIYWNSLLGDGQLTDEMIDEFASKFYWDHDTCEYDLCCAEWVLENHIDKINWIGLSCNNRIKFSPQFIKKHCDRFLNWGVLAQRHSYLIKDGHLDILLKKGITWEKICFYQRLDEDFIRKYADKIDWINVMEINKFSIEFIEEFIDEMDNDLLVEHQDLTENFIEKYKKDLNWNLISQYQNLSEEFIIKHRNKINFNLLTDVNSKTLESVKVKFRKYRYKVGYYECVTDELNFLNKE